MLVLLSGVSGAGKDTIKKELLKRMDNATTMPSYTDREPREGEVDGEIYNFITTAEFEEKIKANEFYEYCLTGVYPLTIPPAKGCGSDEE